MATLLSIRRSDKFPVGTVVKAFPGPENRHYEGKPSGTATAEATVDTSGRLQFTTLPEGIWRLWAEVAGTNANLEAANITWTLPGTLKQRIAARQAAAGV